MGTVWNNNTQLDPLVEGNTDNPIGSSQLGKYPLGRPSQGVPTAWKKETDGVVFVCLYIYIYEQQSKTYSMSSGKIHFDHQSYV